MMVASVEYADIPSPIGTFRIVYQGVHVQVVDLLENGISQTGLPFGATRRKAPFTRGTPPRQLLE